MGKMQRDKGARGERQLAEKLSKLLGVEAYRSCQYAGKEGAGDVLGVPGVHVESKYTERLNLYAAMDQAEEDCGKEIPVVFHRKNLRQWVAIVNLDQLVELARAIVEIVDDCDAGK